MNDNSIKASSLRGRPVVSLDRPEKLGAVDDIIFDLGSSQVAAFVVVSGLFGSTKALPPGAIREIGADAITVSDAVVLLDHSPLPADSPDRAQLSDLLGSKVVSEQGALLGTLGDVELDATGSRITCFEMSGTLWEKLRHSERTFAPEPGLRAGRQLLVVPGPVAVELSTRSGEASPPAGPT